MRRKRRHRSARQWRQIISDWQRSELSVSQFCRDSKVPTSAFYRWKRRLSQAENHEQAPFIQVAWPTAKDTALELTCPGGHVLRFSETAHPKTLVSVLSALKEVGL